MDATEEGLRKHQNKWSGKVKRDKTGHKSRPEKRAAVNHRVTELKSNTKLINAIQQVN